MEAGMRGRIGLLMAVLVVSGCADAFGAKPPETAPTEAATPGAVAHEATLPGTAMTAPPPKPAARTAAALDTTTPEQRAAAAAKPAASAETRLGSTIASLGDPTDPGFWLRTGLVSAETPGRIEDPRSGKSAQVTLIPSGRDAGAGSEASLPALRLLEVDLTDLPELVVFRL